MVTLKRFHLFWGLGGNQGTKIADELRDLTDELI
jgi:hypothetical protein